MTVLPSADGHHPVGWGSALDQKAEGRIRSFFLPAYQRELGRLSSAALRLGFILSTSQTFSL